MQCISSKVQCCSLIFSSSLSEPSLFFLLMFQIPSEHFYHISIIFLSYFTSVKSIISLSVNTESMDIYGKRMRVTGLKKSGDVFFFRIKVKVRILRKTKQNNRSTLFFFTVALTLFHTYQRIYYMIIL